MNSRPNCQTRVTGDQYYCAKCDLVWDIDDLEPPECRTTFKVKVQGYVLGSPSHDKEIEKMRELLKND